MSLSHTHSRSDLIFLATTIWQWWGFFFYYFFIWREVAGKQVGDRFLFHRSKRRRYVLGAESERNGEEGRKEGKGWGWKISKKGGPNFRQCSFTFCFVFLYLHTYLYLLNPQNQLMMTHRERLFKLGRSKFVVVECEGKCCWCCWIWFRCCVS